ncbi:hypothetical protein CMV_012726 [Castanea mollissima]|uniref:Uncharacterized protein n=1 Tax=Castanea mollissima TaxID=60419 RepID=A0A8J4RGR3_9ROSI|nr:hypothetical protein CMV_012726 [Castanea mollissima]
MQKPKTTNQSASSKTQERKKFSLSFLFFLSSLFFDLCTIIIIIGLCCLRGFFISLCLSLSLPARACV